MNTKILCPELLHKIDAYWRAANYLSVGQIYFYDNPLLKRPLTLADVKHLLLGHWRDSSPCVVDDGEAEIGPLATAWHSNRFLNPATDGAVRPILHLNGYKISNPNLLA